MHNNDEETIPNDFGHQLVDLLYSNTELNYDVAASNLILVFQHLSKRLPNLINVSRPIMDSIQVNE